MDVYEAVSSRRAVRGFTDQPERSRRHRRQRLIQRRELSN